ncbi:hypothetical protein [Paraburkholderia sp.]|uniref:hypothetical protein n=1 Tax=Paraburkholderia sp. TaxID=1926495 RepID=UPI002F3E8E69
MVDLRMARDAASLARRAYALQPVRSRTVRAAIWVTVCACSVGAGAGAMYWYAHRVEAETSACVQEPVSPDSAQAELERTRLALAQEAAARVAVQKAANAAAAEVSRLNTELLFLRAQGQKRR